MTRPCYICKQELPEEAFNACALKRQPGRDPCKACASIKRKERRLANPEHFRQQDKARYQKYKHTWAKWWNWKQYGLTPEDVQAMFERQKGKCLGCHDDLPLTREKGKTFVIDHCHKTGTIRGLLCNPCNRALGFLNEEPENLYQLAAYLELDRSKPVVYLIGSLRNAEVPHLGNQMRELGLEVIDNWFAAGPIADDSWQEYSDLRGRTYKEALQSREAKHVFHFDRAYLNLADAVVLLFPAGKSAALEFGYAIGNGKKGYMLMEQPTDRYDVMMQFADSPLLHDRNALFEYLKRDLIK